MIEKIISGGQYGADVGGLAAAYDSKIPTGGFAPKGYKTIYGSNPKLKVLGLVECESPSYRVRTYENVKHSDGTIRLAYSFETPGEKCTLHAIKTFKKPHIDIDLNSPLDPFDVVKWLVDYKIKVLNVAGNAGYSKEESDLIFKRVREYLKLVLKEYGGIECELKQA